MTTLTMKEEKRLEVIQRVFRGELTVVEAGMVIGVSERQCYRIKARVTKRGAKGVVHGNRGRPCKHKTKEKEVKRVVELAKGKYQGFNDRHLTEKLVEQEKLENKHRSRRERKAAEGMMLQVDGSPHHWLEGRGPSLCLIGAIDDATGKVVGAMFVEAESTWGYFRLFSEVFNKHGLPQSVYADRHSIFWTDREPTLEEQLKNQRPSTEVGRGLQKLGVTLIPAGSPQAKGRIERLWGTFQDRLVSELRRAGAKTQAQAQIVLERYLPEHNRKFSKSPALSEPAWRKASSTQIQRALCFKQKRTVAKDHTVTFEGTLFQIPKHSPYRSFANTRIDVHVLLDGAVEFFYQNEKIARFDSKTTHTIGLYRTIGKREGFRYGPLSALSTKTLELSP